MIKSVYRLIKKTITNFSNKWYKERIRELEENLPHYLRQIDGIEIPYYTLPKEIWNARGICQVFSPIKKESIVYDSFGKETSEKKCITTSVIITSQLFNNNGFECSKYFEDCKTKREEYSLVKVWVRFFRRIYWRNLFKRGMNTYAIPILIAVISAVVSTVITKLIYGI